MKKLVVLLVILFMNITLSANEGTPTFKEIKEEIRSKIVKLLGQPNFKINQEIKVTVELLVNKNGEIVVLDVNSKNKIVNQYVKGKLNYKKVYKKLNHSAKVFKMPLRILK